MPYVGFLLIGFGLSLFLLEAKAPKFLRSHWGTTYFYSGGLLSICIVTNTILGMI